MRKHIIQLLLLVSICAAGFGQHVGIGTNLPTAPLSFNNSAGTKMVFGLHYGEDVDRIEVSSNALWVKSKSTHSIAFGYGNSAAFQDNFYIEKIAADPFNLTYSTAIGIRNKDPKFPLDVTGRARLFWGASAAALSIKFHEFYFTDPNSPYTEITAPNQLSLINSNTLVFKPRSNSNAFGVQTTSGAIVLNGSFGSTNQYASGQNRNPSYWKNLSIGSAYVMNGSANQTSSISLTDAQPEAYPPGLTQTIILAEPGKIYADFNVQVQAPTCTFCGVSKFQVWVYLNNVFQRQYSFSIANGRVTNAEGSSYLNLEYNPFRGELKMNIAPAGTYTVSLLVKKISGPPINIIGSGATASSLLVAAITPN